MSDSLTHEQMFVIRFYSQLAFFFVVCYVPSVIHTDIYTYSFSNDCSKHKKATLKQMQS